MIKLDTYRHLATEKQNPSTRRLDRLTPKQLAAAMNREDRKIILAVRTALPAIAQVIVRIAHSFRHEGRLFFVGAGTSGRLGVIEAAECPPTFNTDPAQIQAFMAGGPGAVFQSKEGAEDNEREGRRVGRRARSVDCVVGIAASGVTPYVREALSAAKAKGATTILLTCNPRFSKFPFVDLRIVLNVGPEVLTGSTRLKSGTACKMALNMLTTGSMVQIGKVYQNWMVDLQPKSRKLVARGQRLIAHLGGTTDAESAKLFQAAGGRVKRAIVMARRSVSAAEADALLKKADGHLGRLLENV